jgi:catechol 2,3-dioxygenase-like lactoylglutathione lyase family enzyme
MTLAAVTLDCADPLTLAAFYAGAIGWELVEGSGEDFAGLRGPGGLFFGLQRVEDYRPPVWPGQEHPQQAHLDFEVDDLDQAEDLLLQRGAVRATQQPDDGRWRVLTDPAGHPFCLTASRTVRQPPASPPTTP